MPSTMQQIMVRNRPSKSELPDTPTMALMSWLARPVTVMQPQMTPAMPQATATVTQERPPASSASKMVFGVNCLTTSPPATPLFSAARL